MISLQSFLGDRFHSDQSESVRIFPVTLASAVRENKLWLIIGKKQLSDHQYYSEIQDFQLSTNTNVFSFKTLSPI